MCKKKTECPKCLGAKTIMEARETKGFDYNKCSLCNGQGEVNSQLADDYIFSFTEEEVDDDPIY